MKDLRIFNVPDLDKDEVLAIKALYAGEANPFQQRLALSVITNKFCRTHDILYIPDSSDQTAFMNGRAFPGTKILQTIKVPIGKLDFTNDKEPD